MKLKIAFTVYVFLGLTMGLAKAQEPKPVGISVEAENQARQILLEEDPLKADQQQQYIAFQRDAQQLAALDAKLIKIYHDALVQSNFDPTKYQVVLQDKNGVPYGRPGFDIASEKFVVVAIPPPPPAKPTDQKPATTTPPKKQ